MYYLPVGYKNKLFFRLVLHLSVLSVCGVSLVEQFELKTEDQNLPVLMQSPVSDPFWSSFLLTWSVFKGAANYRVKQASLVFPISAINISHECVQQVKL